MVADLGAAVYDALDFSLPGDQQRTLGRQLEQGIEMMTSGDDDDEDEGLGVEERTGLVEAVIEVCRSRLRSPKTANDYYRSVVRAFVLEGCELSSFMDRVDNFYQDQEDEGLEAL